MAKFELTFPPDEREYLKKWYGNASMILEYGSGGSTVFGACETDATLLSIESDKAWTDELNTVLAEKGVDPARARTEWVDIGATKKWGYPRDHTHWRDFPDYVLKPWEEGFAPDLVLIDGRFRRACFAATLMMCENDTTVLFDDYSSRKTYQQVEALIKPVEIVGRMARFEVSPGLDIGRHFPMIVRWFFKLN